MSLHLSVSLWPHAGQADALVAYEDTVLALLPRHGSTILSRVRRVGGPDPDDHEPFEVQLIELPDEAALTAYLEDPERTALAAEHRRVIARTELVRVERVN